jgi:hypothetical protein
LRIVVVVEIGRATHGECAADISAVNEA